MEYGTLILLHVFFGILWAGGAIAAGFFIIPAVLEAGPAGGAVMGGVVKRRFPVVMTASALVVVLTGLRLYSMRLSLDWLATGRLTSEMVIKVAQMGIPILMSRSGITQMGLKLARDLGVIMFSRVQGKHFLIYNGSEHIIFDQELAPKLEVANIKKVTGV